MLEETNEIMYGAATFAQRKQAANSIVNMCKSGNFKLGALFEALKIIGLYGIVDRVLKKKVHKCINNELSAHKPLRKATEGMLQSLHEFKLKQPEQFKKLVAIASDTYNYNDTVFRVFIFMIYHCADAVEFMLTRTLDARKIYDEVMKAVPFTLKPIVKGVTRVVNVYWLFEKAERNLKTAVHNLIQKIKSMTANGTMEGIMKMNIEPIKKMISSVDPIGFLTPVSTYVCFDIIVRRVDKNKLKLPLPLGVVILMTVIVLIIVVVIVSWIRSKINEKEQFYENATTQDILFHNDERWKRVLNVC
jgi:hypothetical protein